MIQAATNSNLNLPIEEKDCGYKRMNTKWQRMKTKGFYYKHTANVLTEQRITKKPQYLCEVDL